jgi:hypothetical protein
MRTFLLAVITICSYHQAESLLIDARYFVRNYTFRLSNDNIVCINNINIPMNEAADPFDNNNVRKRRKNKYENFSRVESDYDPLDTLIEESNRKNQDIITKICSTKNEISKTDEFVNSILESSVPKKVFPDVKNIDVSPISNTYLIIPILCDNLISSYFCILNSRMIQKRLDIC